MISVFDDFPVRAPIGLRFYQTQVRVQLHASADNVALLAFAADRRAAVDTDRKAAAPAADALCSNRSISPACGPQAANPPHAAAAA